MPANLLRPWSSSINSNTDTYRYIIIKRSEEGLWKPHEENESSHKEMPIWLIVHFHQEPWRLESSGMTFSKKQKKNTIRQKMSSNKISFENKWKTKTFSVPKLRNVIILWPATRANTPQMKEKGLCECFPLLIFYTILK